MENDDIGDKHTKIPCKDDDGTQGATASEFIVREIQEVNVSYTYENVEYSGYKRLGKPEGTQSDGCCNVSDEIEDDQSTGSCDFADVGKYENSTEKTEKEESSDPALLPPDHPLMQKFQQSLREYLLRSKETLKNELGELEHQLKSKRNDRETHALKLYDMQEKIKHQSEQLEEFGKSIIETQQNRIKQEEEQRRLQKEHEQVLQQVKEQKALYNKRVAELENAQTLDNNLTQWTDSVEDEVKNAQRMVSRDTQLQRKIAEEKRKADLLFYHVDVEVKRSESEKQLLLEELTEMRQAVETLNMSISNANADLEALQMEHKRLTQAWNQVIIAISHRDKVLYQAETAIDKEKEFIKLTNASIEGINKQIRKELEENDKLEAFKNRLINDFNSLKRDCLKEVETLNGLQFKIEQIPLWMKETEDELHDAKKEGTQIATELRRISYKMDKKYAKKNEIEEAILKIAQDRLLNDKSSEYRLKLLRQSQDQRRTLELNLSQTQNQLANELLELEKMKSIIQKLREENVRLSGSLNETEDKANDIEKEIKHVENQIDKKLSRLDKFMKQLDELMRSNVGSGNPTELKIKEIEKTIQIAEQQIREHQQFWLMLQNHYVNLSQKRNQQLNEIQITRKQFSIIKQKSLKIDNDLEKMENSSCELKREIQNYVTKIDILNGKISQKRQQHESEEAECEMEHGELLEKLKKHEMGVLELEQEISDLQTEIEQYKDLVLDKHRETLTWETKYKLIEETLRWRKDERAAESEISQMKAEIHRMEIRHQQLQRAQEKLVQDLDHAVLHREQIFTVTRVKRIMETKIRTKTNTTMSQKVADMRVKLQKTQAEVSDIRDNQITKASHEYHQLEAEVNRLRKEVTRLTEANQCIFAEIEKFALSKRQNLENIVRKQNRAKFYKDMCVCKKIQPKLPRSAEVLDTCEQKQMDITDNLTDLLQSLINDFPEKKTLFENLLQSYKF